MDSKTMEISGRCKSCHFNLLLNMYFCPQCGSPNISNSILSLKSTATFDPLNKDSKPWRDAPLIPVRDYHGKAADDKFSKPWVPTMKQPKVEQKKRLLKWKWAVPKSIKQLEVEKEDYNEAIVVTEDVKELDIVCDTDTDCAPIQSQAEQPTGI